MLGYSISKNSFILAMFALITAVSLALINLGTKDRIAAAERAAQQRALADLIPPDHHTNDLLNDTLPIPASAQAQLGLTGEVFMYVARKNQHIVALVIPAIAHDGYSGDIEMIIAIRRDGTLAGVRVLKHKETPGLGDKIDLKKDQWILSFNDKSLENPAIEHWQVKKDGGAFDQFAGATITPRAVVNQIKRALEFVATNPQLFNHSPPLSTKGNDYER